ncbi:MAG: hypothetical protein AAGC61_01910 [Microbacterium sp.]
MTVVRAIFFIPAQPIGGRCSWRGLNDDRTEENHWCFTIDEVREELRLLKENDFDPELNWAQHKDLWDSLKGLIHKAKDRRLHIADEPSADAKVIRETILELRPFLGDSRPVFGKRPRILRLYYGEPAAEPGCLLALHLDTKEADASGRHEQNRAIEEALSRAERWARAA